MGLVGLDIVRGVNGHNSIMKNVRVDDWTVERASIASIDRQLPQTKLYSSNWIVIVSTGPIGI